MSGRTSVVIPCYREDQYLLAALDSVANQSASVKEVIVVDDGSPEPIQRPKRWIGPELIWIRTENRGLGAARNRGIKVASGEFVGFLDADDLWEPEKIQQQESHLDERSESVACYTRCVQKEGFYAFGPYPDEDLPRGELGRRIWHGQFYPPSSMLIRREAMIACGGFKEGLINGEDLVLNFQLLNVGDITGVQLPLTLYRVHEGQITSDAKKKILGAKYARQIVIDSFAELLIECGVPRSEFWHAHRDKIFRTYFRRDFIAARPMLWDYWKDNPLEFRALGYFLMSLFPSKVVEAFRGRI